MIQVDLETFLKRAGLTSETLTLRLRDELDLRSSDALFAGGSLVEGLGNERSDLDLCLVTPRTDLPVSAAGDLAVRLGSVVCDVQVLTREKLDGLIETLEALPVPYADVRTVAKALSFGKRRLLHRLHSGVAVFGRAEVEALQNRVAGRALTSQKLASARYDANVYQLDLVGMRDAGDWDSLVLTAQHLLSCTVDALLAGFGRSNPSPKWRARLLQALPADWESHLPGGVSGLGAADRFFDLQRAPVRRTAAEVHRFALRIAAFSRAVFPWAEERMLSGGGAPPPLPGPIASAASREVLPHLDLDVAVRRVDGGFELFRMNQPAHRYHLTPDLQCLVSLFDGETSREEVRRQARAAWGEEGEEKLDGVTALLENAGFFARPVVDEAELWSVLHRA